MYSGYEMSPRKRQMRVEAMSVVFESFVLVSCFFMDAKLRLLWRKAKKTDGFVKRLLSCVNKCCVRTQNLVVNQQNS